MKPSKALYEPSSYSIGQYRCVAVPKDDKSVPDDPIDMMISGTKGWIFYANKAKSRLGVVVVTRGYNENLTYCNVSDLKDVVSRIGVLRDLERGAYYANNPDARHLLLEAE
jgi:hypothetical protein